MKNHARLEKSQGFFLYKSPSHGGSGKNGNLRKNQAQIGGQDLFTIIFAGIEDKRKIIKDGPYLFNLSNIYLQYKTKKKAY